MLLKIQWGKEEITKGGIFKISKINFMKKKIKEARGKSFDNQRLLFWYSKS